MHNLQAPQNIVIPFDEAAEAEVRRQAEQQEAFALRVQKDEHAQSHAAHEQVGCACELWCTQQGTVSGYTDRGRADRDREMAG